MAYRYLRRVIHTEKGWICRIMRSIWIVSSNDRLLRQTEKWVQIFHVAQRLMAAQRSGYAIIILIYVQIFIMFNINEQRIY